MQTAKLLIDGMTDGDSNSARKGVSSRPLSAAVSESAAYSAAIPRGRVMTLDDNIQGGFAFFPICEWHDMG